MIRFFLSLLAVVTTATTSAEVGPDEFRFVDRREFGVLRAMSVAGSDIFALGDYSSLRFDANFLGQLLNPTAQQPLDRLFTGLAADERHLCLYDNEKQLVIYSRDASGEQELFAGRLPDTVFAAKLEGDRLYTAEGIAGIAIRDINNPAAPRILDRLTQGADYRSLEVNEDWIVGLDVLNGADVYHRAAGEIQFHKSLPVDRKLLGTSLRDSSLAICDYSQVVILHTLSSDSQGRHATELELPFLVTNVQLLEEFLIAGGSRGELALVSLADHHVSDLLSLGVSLLQLDVAALHGAENVVVLDRLGRLTIVEIRSGRLLVRQVYRPQLSLSASAADGEDLVFSGADGLSRASISSGLFTTRYSEIGAAASALAVFDDYLFIGASTGLTVYDCTRHDWYDLIASWSTCGTVQKIVLSDRGEHLAIELITADRIIALRFSPAINSLALRWEKLLLRPVVAFGGSSEWIVASGDCDTLTVIQRETGESWKAAIGVCARDIELTDNRHLVVAHAAGVNTYAVDAAAKQLRFEDSPPAISEARSLAFDPAAQLLFVASDRDAVKYCDFSDPEQTGIFYALPFSQGTHEIQIAGDNVFAITSSALIAYQRSTPHPKPQSADLFVTPFYPNPFNASTTAGIVLNNRGGGTAADFRVLDVLGRTVKRGELRGDERQFNLTWDATDDANRAVASGIYFVVVATPAAQVVRKVVLLK